VSTGRAGVASLVAGLAVIATVQLLAPMRQPPVYDGVVVEEPYRYVSPAGAEAGNPTSYTGSEPVSGTQSPAFAAATGESPPQAQLIAQAGAFAISGNITELRVSIIPAAPDPADSVIGNAYRFEVTGPDGTAVEIPSGSFVTLALRAPTGATGVTIVKLESGVWQPAPVMESGQPDVYLANVDALGVFATRGTLASTSVEPNVWAKAIGIATAAVFVVVAASLLWPHRRPRAPSADANAEPVTRKCSQSRPRGRR